MKDRVRNLVFRINEGDERHWVEAPANYDAAKIEAWYKDEWQVNESEIFEVLQLTEAEQMEVMIRWDEVDTMSETDELVPLHEIICYDMPEHFEPMIVASSTY